MHLGALDMDRSVTFGPEILGQLQPAGIVSRPNATVQIAEDVGKESLLVLAGNRPADGTAYANWVVTPMIKVDGTFQGVWVLPGRYDVRMIYRPPTLDAALALAGPMSLLLIPLRLSSRRVGAFLGRLFPGASAGSSRA